MTNPSDLFDGPVYDVRKHYDNVKALWDTYPLNNEDACVAHTQQLIKKYLVALDVMPSDEFGDELGATLHLLYEQSQLYIDSFPPFLNTPYQRSGLEELAAKLRPERITVADRIIHDLLETFSRHFAPPSIYVERTDNQIATPLCFLMPSPDKFVGLLIGILADADTSGALPFVVTHQILLSNVIAASGQKPDNVRVEKLVWPNQSELPPLEMTKAYLKGTPFLELLTMTVPFTYPDAVRFEHTHILGGSGHGKSTLLAKQFLDDVQSKDPPSLIIIDGKGTFVEAIQRFKIFEPGTALSEKLVIVNPQDTEPPALNLFVPPIRPGIVPEEVRRQIENSTIALFEYIFSANDFKLTAKQATCLSYCVRLLFSLKPTATIHTLLDLLNDRVNKMGGIPDESPFRPFIEQQPAIVRRYFTDLFYHPTEYGETKRQIQNRVFDLLENPAFSAMFSTSERKLDLFDIIQNRKILLVNSSPNALGEKGAPVLGRYIVALALSSAYGRLALPKEQWRPAYLIIDEAQMFVDEDKTQPLLQQAREFNLGVTLAHQKLADLTPTLIATLAANTSIRYAGGVSAADASFMAKNMHCEPEFIMSQRKTAQETHFATHVRGYTESAISLSLPLGIIGNQPLMTKAAHDVLIQRNHTRIAATKSQKTPIAPSPVEATPAPATKPPEAPKLDNQSESGPTW